MNFSEVFNFFSKAEKIKIIIIFIAFLFAAFLETLSLALIIPIISILVEGKDILLSNELLNKFFSDEFTNFLKSIPERKLLFYVIILMLFSFVLKNIYLIASFYFVYKTLYNFQIQLSLRIFKKYLYSNYEFFLNSEKSSMIRNINDEAGTFIRRLIVPGVLWVCELLTLLFIFVFLVTISLKASVTVFLVCFFFILIVWYASKKIVKKWGLARHVYAKKKYKNLIESFNSIIEIKLKKAEDFFYNLFDQNNSRNIKADRNIDILNGLPKYVFEICGVLAFCSLLFFLIISDINNKSIITLVGLYAAAAFKALPCLSKLISYSNSFIYGYKAFEKIKDELSKFDKKNINSLKPKKIEPHKEFIFEKVKFSNVSFKYKNNEVNCLEKVNFLINKGEFVAFVGPSGAGKSTLTLLLTNLLKPSSGKITLNDQINLEDNQDQYFKTIGYISQKTILLDTNVKENIAFGVPLNEINRDRINEVIKLSQLESFIRDLPNGTDTTIGDDGIRISGGQRQRLAIARALYHNPKVLIMDEATSSLDKETENNLLKVIKSLKGKITLIFITHKLDLLDNFDKVFEINNKVVKEI